MCNYPLIKGMHDCPLFFAVTLAENFSTFGEIEAVKVQNLSLPKIKLVKQILVIIITDYIMICLGGRFLGHCVNFAPLS